MIILKEFRRLIKEKMYFFIMLCTIQVVVTFGVLFLLGVIDNTKNVMNQDYLTKRFAVSVLSDATYKDVENVVKKLAMDESNNISEVSLYGSVPTANGESQISLASYFAINKGGKYIKSANDLRYEKALKTGRFYTVDEMNSGTKVAVGRYYDEELCGPLVIGKEKYEIVGNIFHGETINDYLIYVTPKAFENVKCFSVDFSSDIIISEKTCNKIIEAMDSVIPGQYITDVIDEKRLDNKGISKSIIGACIFLLALVTCTIISIYSFWISENNYRLGVWKLIGCKHLNAANIYTFQMMIITIPSVVFGSILFVIIKNRYLLNIYPYMNYFYSCKVYLEIGMLIFIVITAFVYLSCVISTRGKIRKILL